MRPGITPRHGHGYRADDVTRGPVVVCREPSPLAELITLGRKLGCMQRLPDVGFPCPVARVTELIGDPWTPLLLRDAMFGVRRFEDFHRYQGIGRNTLSSRLRRLVEAGVLETRLYQDYPPRKEYLLTDKGGSYSEWSQLCAPGASVGLVTALASW
jgi:DNA-binding HxlR family transcriptional regulator